MEIVQEYSITQAGDVSISLNDDYQVLQAVTIGSSSKLRVVVDTSKPVHPITFSVIPLGTEIGDAPKGRMWFGRITIGQQVCDVFQIF
jgi:hypothetical protein